MPCMVSRGMHTAGQLGLDGMAIQKYHITSTGRVNN